jgi:DNA-binding transcriptional ArsR family regulator
MRVDQDLAELHHPTRRKLLTVLAEGQEIRKGELASLVYGEANNSTRAMTTRATAALVAAGFLDERLEGRERLVKLTPRGHDIVRSWATAELKRSAWRSGDQVPTSASNGHACDRQRFHLRHCALLGLAALRARGDKPRDEHYKQLLLTLIDQTSDAAADAKFFYGNLQRSWPRDDFARLLLAECIVRFQSDDKNERRATLDDLIVVGDAFGDDLKRDPYLQPVDLLAWATCATVVAHHHLLEPEFEARRIDARGILNRVLGALAKLKQLGNPALDVAITYRHALAGKVLFGTWTADPAPAGTVAPAHADGVSGWQLAELEKVDAEVRRSTAINAPLDGFEFALTRSVGTRIMRALPDAEPFFRRVRHRDATRELNDWMHHRKHELAELLQTTATRQGDEELARRLVAFQSAAQQLPEDDPHVRQCALLLGQPIRSVTPPADLSIDHGAVDHGALVLNNLWTPEMVAVDVAAAVV